MCAMTQKWAQDNATTNTTCNGMLSLLLTLSDFHQFCIRDLDFEARFESGGILQYRCE
jgi:hypothetical protein